MISARSPAVAGRFYADDPEALLQHVDSLLEQAESPPSAAPRPRAIIAPHAGYIYSGPIAATVYRRIRSYRQQIKRVAIFGPSHRLSFDGLALADNDVFSTPLGDITLDKDASQRLLRLSSNDAPIQYLNQAHTQEHSLEVQLPFLQRVLTTFSLIPIVVGDNSVNAVAAAIDDLWRDDTLIIISSDLSHYQDYATAQQRDQHTSRAIVGLHGEDIAPADACGRNPLLGLLQVARQRGLQAETIDLRNSGDTAGNRDRVVGYGAYVFH